MIRASKMCNRSADGFKKDDNQKKSPLERGISAIPCKSFEIRKILLQWRIRGVLFSPTVKIGQGKKIPFSVSGVTM
jgi:hypothetical protein